MHAYATDARDRETVPPLLAVLAVAATLLLNSVLAALKLAVPWWLDAPSVMGFYGTLHFAYDQYVWRSPISARLGWGIPDIHGIWSGEIHSAYRDRTTVVPAVFTVQQTWSKLCVRLETEQSTSISELAALNPNESTHAGLSYEYRNEPKNLSKRSMHAHRGSVRLTLSSDGKELTGDYFNGRDRGTTGSMHFSLKSR